MGSQGITSYGEAGGRKPAPSSLPASDVQIMLKQLAAGFKHNDPATGMKIGRCVGVYAFMDYDDQPIYVGQTMEGLATRVRRHLSGQRTDAVAYRILDPAEVATIRLYPAQDLDARDLIKKRDSSLKPQIDMLRSKLNSLEFAVYEKLIEESDLGVILNETLPPQSPYPVTIPPFVTVNLIPDELRLEWGHPDRRIARRAETLARAAAVAKERGEVSPGLRRGLVVQAARLTALSSARLAYVEGRPHPPEEALDLPKLVGGTHRPANIVEEIDADVDAEIEEIQDSQDDGAS